jgi:hypothetical protein
MQAIISFMVWREVRNIFCLNYASLNGVVSSSDYTESNDRVINE